MNTGNPVFGILDKAQTVGRSQSMTVNGVIGKTAFLLMLVMGSMIWIWPQQVSQMTLIILSVAGLVAALGTSFFPNYAWLGAPAYAVLEGLVLGVISAMLERIYPGIAVQAVALTFAVLFAMLGLYVTRIIVVTQQFRSCLMAATGGVCLFYFVSMILGFFGVHVPGYGMGGGWLGIGISLVVVGIASFNFLLDFDSIETGAREGAPRAYEWVCAFGLLVTVVWLYLEILRLLARLRDSR